MHFKEQNTITTNSIIKTPKVSVCVVTYNQEKLIAQCLQTLVDQQTNFEFEIIVSDDCSQDGTREIIMEFKNKYPNIVKPIFHEKNLGALKNFAFVHSQATGQYVAHMDGDDYSLPGKLQSQADFLDANKDCNFVWHPVLYEKSSGHLTKPTDESLEYLFGKRFTRGDILSLISIGVNSSKMYRKNRIYNLPDFELVDYYMNVEQVGEGYAAFCSREPLGVYRVGIGIASSGFKTRDILCKCFSCFGTKYPKFKAEICAAAFVNLLADFKNKRTSYKMFYKEFVRSFRLRFIFVLLGNLKTLRHMRIV